MSEGKTHPIRTAWRTYRWLRILTWITGLLGGTGVFGSISWTLARTRLHGELLAGSPEYAVNQTTPADGLPVTDPPISIRADPHLIVMAGVILLTVIPLIVFIRWPMRRPHNTFDRDPRRLFTDQDKDWCRQVTGGRCEKRSLFGLIRCRRPVEQFDHWWPYAHGGATERQNMAGMCAACNRRKSDRIPTRLETRRLYYARLEYWPARWRGLAMPDGTARRATVCDDDDMDPGA